MTAVAPLAELRAQLGPALPPRRSWRCPCGCAGPRDPECARLRPRSRNAARAAWRHLSDAGLLDGDGFQTGLLAEDSA